MLKRHKDELSLEWDKRWEHLQLGKEDLLGSCSFLCRGLLLLLLLLLMMMMIRLKSSQRLAAPHILTIILVQYMKMLFDRTS